MRHKATLLSNVLISSAFTPLILLPQFPTPIVTALTIELSEPRSERKIEGFELAIFLPLSFYTVQISTDSLTVKFLLILLISEF